LSNAANAYINKAEHNINLAKTLVGMNRFSDWAITSSFYAALHYVNAHACKRNIRFEAIQKQVSPHTMRRRYVRKYLKSLYTKYERLFQESLNARYDPYYLEYMSPDKPTKMLSIALEFRNCVN